jgi:hypothetical protein
MQDYFLDGTRIEANAGRYGFLRKQAVQKHKAGVRKKVKDLPCIVMRQRRKRTTPTGIRISRRWGKRAK